MGNIVLPTDEKSQKLVKKRLLLILLYTATLLFVIWLVTLFLLLFFSSSDSTEGHKVLDKLYEITDLEIGSLKITNRFLEEDRVGIELEGKLEEVERDKMEPTMKELLKERSFDIERFDAIFENMKRAKIPSKDPTHSTFGKDVVYIYHTHSRESYLPYFKDTNKPEEAYQPTTNITVVGKMLGKALERRGVGTKVDPTDIVKELSLKGLDFNSSYKISGDRVRSALAKNKDLEIFLDLHRDSVRKDSSTKEINGMKFAEIVFVVGTGHEKYTENLQFAEGLDNLLSIQYPGLSKGIITKGTSQGNGVYNQDISPSAVIIEIGGVDNTLEEINRTTEAFATVFSDYYWHRKK